MADQEYWMSLESEQLASKMDERHTNFFVASSNTIYQTWCKNLYYYYSNVLESQSSLTALNFTGEQGELVQMRVPQARSLIRQLLTLATKQKLAFSAIAETSDRPVVEEMRICDAICEDTVKDKELDLIGETMVENGLVVGTGYLYVPWRTDMGTPFTVDDQGNIIYDGAPDISAPFITDVIYDFTKSVWKDNDWAEVRTRRNRWNLIAQHPDLAAAIKALPSAQRQRQEGMDLWMANDDDVYVYELYHRPSPALPQGRMMMYSDPKTVYFDGENMYGCIPIEQYKPEVIAGMGFGYPMFSALLPSQEMFDHEASCIATNHSAYGVHNVTVPRQAAISSQEINGLNYISYTPQPVPGGGKPEPLNLQQASPEAFKFMETLLSSMQQISNINGALRGDVGQDTSGTAIATLSTNAIEFLNSYIKTYLATMQKGMYHVINAYTRFAKNERMIRLVGKNNQTYLKKFKGEQLRAITGVKIQEVNPLMQTLAGRLEFANQAAKNGYVENMKDYAAIVDGEPVKKLFEEDLSESDLISSENQMLMDGKPVHAMSIDCHPEHIFSHKTLLTAEVRAENQALVKAVNDHILEHLGLAQTTSPLLMGMAATGKMPEIPQAPAPGQAPTGGPSQGPNQMEPATTPAGPANDLLGRA